MTQISCFLFLALFSALCAGQVLVDPTRPSQRDNTSAIQGQNSTGNGSTPLLVSATFINGQNKHAIINGMSYKEGQSIHGFKLISIANNKIIVKNVDGQQTFFVTNSSTLKKDTTNGF